MHPQQQTRAFVYGAFVVGNARAIRGTHLAQNRPRLRHHVRNAERAPDFDQFPARDDHLSSLGERIEREQNRSRVIVHHDRRNHDGRNIAAPGALCRDVFRNLTDQLAE